MWASEARISFWFIKTEIPNFSVYNITIFALLNVANWGNVTDLNTDFYVTWVIIENAFQLYNISKKSEITIFKLV